MCIVQIIHYHIMNILYSQNILNRWLTTSCISSSRISIKPCCNDGVYQMGRSVCLQVKQNNETRRAETKRPAYFLVDSPEKWRIQKPKRDQNFFSLWKVRLDVGSNSNLSISPQVMSKSPLSQTAQRSGLNFVQASFFLCQINWRFVHHIADQILVP